MREIKKMTEFEKADLNNNGVIKRLNGTSLP